MVGLCNSNVLCLLDGKGAAAVIKWACEGGSKGEVGYVVFREDERSHHKLRSCIPDLGASVCDNGLFLMDRRGPSHQDDLYWA